MSFPRSQMRLIRGAAQYLHEGPHADLNEGGKVGLLVPT